ncbi:transposase [Bradyrhizobium elkanii]|uniref:transposase n=1 Tax=Bradyrhizobium elkanii TaxID=29448 RepID=UPI00351409A3
MLEIGHEHRGAARRKRTPQGAFGANAGGLERASGGALAASEEARRRLEIILGELRREKFGAKSEKLRPDQYHLPLEDVEIRARHPGRGARESRGCDQWPITERAGSRSSSQSRLLACPFAAGGTDHRACEHALSVRLLSIGVQICPLVLPHLRMLP